MKITLELDDDTIERLQQLGQFGNPHGQNAEILGMALAEAYQTRVKKTRGKRKKS